GERASALGDRGLLAVRVKDAHGETLGAFESLGADLERLHERVILGTLPEGAVELELTFRAHERHGDKNSVTVDRIDLTTRPIEGRTPRLSKSPLVYGFGASELAVIFETDGLDVMPTLELVSANGQLIATPAMTTTTVDARHFVHLAPLPTHSPEADGEPIRYRVRLGDELSPTWELEAPRTTGRLRMAWIADNQHGWQTFRTLIPRLNESQIDLLFVAGDFVQHGYKLREWQTEWFSPLSIDGFGQTTPIMMARGNHDANGALAHAYAPLPGNGHWHAFSRNGVRFIVLDTESDTARTPAQLRWLADELASDASRYAELRIVTFHKPPFSNRWHSKKSTYNGESWVRQHLVPLFEQHQVDLVVAGHAHAYQRRDEGGVRYVVVGGAGGALDRYKTGRWPMTVDHVGHHYAMMEVSDRRLSWVARDFEGQLIDSFELVSRTRHLGR
ncbi:MAG TPA: metallophosphoesterase, partial [Myxococcota bacterium]|nr:metallophosphoesterase [Myxococcota bacterium]